MNHSIPWKTLVLSGSMLLAGAPAPVCAQDTEVEKLKSTVQSMEQTIQEMNRQLAELQQQNATAAITAAPPATAGQTMAPVPGVPPPTHPGASPLAQPEVPAGELAELGVPFPYRDTMHEDPLSAPRPGNAPLDPTYKGFMQLFGTKTWIKLGGYAKLDAIADSTKVGNPNFFVTSRIPVEGEDDYSKDGRFTMHAKQTRINLELRSPTPIGSLKIFYENDFFNNNTEPSMDYRLRHFYGQVANITVGQTWSTFYDPDVNPDTLDFEGPGVLPVLRQPQLRYILPVKKDAMYTALAIEQPRSDLGELPDGTDGRNLVPDFTGHWRLEGKPGHLQIGGVLRILSFDGTNGVPDDDTLGWGANVSGALKIFRADSLLASFSYGDGIGRYIQDLPSGSAGVIDADGNIHTLTAWGAMVAYRHEWTERVRSTVSYSYVQLDNRAEQGDFAYDNTHYAQGNLIFAPTKNFYVGIEYLYGLKETRNGNTGDDHRVQLSFQYKLVR